MQAAEHRPQGFRADNLDGRPPLYCIGMNHQPRHCVSVYYHESLRFEFQFFKRPPIDTIFTSHGKNEQTIERVNTDN